MCNLSDGVEARGEIKMAITNIKALMDSLNTSVEEAMNLLNLPQELRSQVVTAIKG